MFFVRKTYLTAHGYTFGGGGGGVGAFLLVSLLSPFEMEGGGGEWGVGWGHFC